LGDLTFSGLAVVAFDSQGSTTCADTATPANIFVQQSGKCVQGFLPANQGRSFRWTATPTSNRRTETACSIVAETFNTTDCTGFKMTQSVASDQCSAQGPNSFFWKCVSGALPLWSPSSTMLVLMCIALLIQY